MTNIGGKGNKRGTPQGVASPLLANIGSASPF